MHVPRVALQVLGCQAAAMGPATTAVAPCLSTSSSPRTLSTTAPNVKQFMVRLALQPASTLRLVQSTVWGLGEQRGRVKGFAESQMDGCQRPSMSPYPLLMADSTVRQWMGTRATRHCAPLHIVQSHVVQPGHQWGALGRVTGALGFLMRFTRLRKHLCGAVRFVRLKVGQPELASCHARTTMFVQ